jgi:uncharacterized integral membrane protein
MRAARWLILLGIALLSGLFAYFNAGERITVNLGFTILYRVSLARVVLGTFLLGMVTMFLVGLRQDLRLRRQLRDLGLLNRRPDPRELPHEEPETTQWGPRV